MSPVRKLRGGPPKKAEKKEKPPATYSLRPKKEKKDGD